MTLKTQSRSECVRRPARVWPAYGGGFHLHRFGSISDNWLCSARWPHGSRPSGHVPPGVAGNWLCFADPVRRAHTTQIFFCKDFSSNSALTKIGFVWRRSPTAPRPPSPVPAAVAGNWLCFAQAPARAGGGRSVPNPQSAIRNRRIGFVLPRPIGCPIHHNPFPAKHLPFFLPRRELALFVQLPLAQGQERGARPHRELGLFGAFAPRPPPRRHGQELGSFCTFRPSEDAADRSTPPRCPAWGNWLRFAGLLTPERRRPQHGLRPQPKCSSTTNCTNDTNAICSAVLFIRVIRAIRCFHVPNWLRFA
jgi:hypothetical protein